MLQRTLSTLLLIVFTVHAVVRADDYAARYGTAIPVPGIEGTLVIAGGGQTPDAAYEAFIEAAGGPENARIVVIPTASRRADRDGAPEYFTQPWRERGLKETRLVHASSREQADDTAFVAPITEATGVWFSGGAQSRITERYLGTKMHEALRALLARGGVIGGTSAGAAIMSDPMIAGGADAPRMAPGLAFLPGCIVDQHAIARDRIGRLHAALEEQPGHVGLAIDEGAAIIVRGRRARVVGEPGAMLCLAAGAGRERMSERLGDGRTIDLIALSRAAVGRASEPFPPVDPPDPVVAGAGTLFIGGGGGLSQDVMRRFVEASGGPEALIIVIPNALGSRAARAGQGDARRLRGAGAENVRIINAPTPIDADSPDNLALLREAGGIWFSGGRQWNIVDAYHGTEAAQLMHELVRRGGAIGGSSAGASIQSQHMPRGHPLGNTVMMAEGYEEGLGFLPGVAIDQHFTQRGRLPDMAALKSTYPQLLGIGIDESTVMIVQGSRFEVVGRHRVLVYDQSPAEVNGEPSYTVVNAGERYDMLKRQRIEEKMEPQMNTDAHG